MENNAEELKKVETMEKNEMLVDIGKELDSESIEKQVRSQLKKEMEEEIILSEEAERVSYLNTLDMDSIEDETTRKIIEEVLASKLKRKDKVESVKKLISQSAILTCLNKAEKMEAGLVNSYALKTLKALKKEGKKLSETQIVQAESAIATIEVDFQRIGKENLSKGLDIQVDMEALTPVERLKFMMSKYQKQELEKREAISK